MGNDRNGKRCCGPGIFWRPRRKQKRLLGLACVLAGVLILICFLPEWVRAIGFGLVFFAIGARLCQKFR